MIDVLQICPAPRGMVIVYADWAKDPAEVDDDTKFIRTEDAAALGVKPGRGNTGVLVLALLAGGECVPARETEAFLGTAWEEDLKELDRMNAISRAGYIDMMKTKGIAL